MYTGNIPNKAKLNNLFLLGNQLLENYKYFRVLVLIVYAKILDNNMRANKLAVTTSSQKMYLQVPCDLLS